MSHESRRRRGKWQRGHERAERSGGRARGRLRARDRAAGAVAVAAEGRVDAGGRLARRARAAVPRRRRRRAPGVADPAVARRASCAPSTWTAAGACSRRPPRRACRRSCTRPRSAPTRRAEGPRGRRVLADRRHQDARSTRATRPRSSNCSTCSRPSTPRSASCACGRGSSSSATPRARSGAYFAGPLLPNALVRPSLIPIVPDTPRLRFQAVHSLDVGDAYRLAVVDDARAAPTTSPPSRCSTRSGWRRCSARGGSRCPRASCARRRR